MQKSFLISRKTLFWLLATVIFVIPLYMKFPFIRLPKTVISIRLEDFLVLVVVGAWFGHMISTKRVIKIFKSDIVFLLLTFLAVSAFSVFSGVYLTKTIKWTLGSLHLIRRLEYLIFLPLVAYVVNTRVLRQKTVSLMFIVALIANLYGLGQKWLRFPAVSTTNAELSKGKVFFLGIGDRVSATFAGHYDLAVFLMMIICMGVPLFIYLIGKKEILKAGFVGMVTLLSFFVLVLTAARFSFLAAFLGIGIAIILVGNKKYILFLILIFSLIMAYPSQLRNRIWATVKVNLLQSFSSFSGVTSEQQNRGRLNIPTLPLTNNEQAPRSGEIPDIAPGEPTDSVDLGVYRSLAIRTNIEWPRAIRAFIKNPFFGTGFSSLGLATDNDYLRSLGESGIFGLTAFILLLAYVFKILIKTYRNATGFDKYLLTGIIALYVAYLANAIFIDVFEASKNATVFWIIIGLAFSVYNQKQNHANINR